jgi:two-component system, LuxR family, response regulator FixJ
MAAKSKFRICIVDDDAAIRESLRLAAPAIGVECVAFSSAQEFLAGFDPKKVGCIILEVSMPGMNGLELQEVLRARKTAIPILILTSHADVPVAVRAMKNGALDVLVKPFSLEVLTDRIKQAFDLYVEWQNVERERQEIADRMAKLTRREREVMGLMADGVKNQDIAKQLGISRKTLDIHRMKVVGKMGARTWADLARWRLLHESGVGGVATIQAGGYLP